MDPGCQEYVLGLGQIQAEYSQPWLNHLSCSYPASVVAQLDNSSDDFRSLPEMPLQPSISAEAELLCDLSRENPSCEKRDVHDIPDEEDAHRHSEVSK